MRTETDDPTIQLWHRVRGPLIVIGMLLIVGSQVDLFLTGRPLPIFTGVMQIAFFVTLVLRLTKLDSRDLEDADRLRARSRTDLWFWGSWAVVGAVWLTWASLAAEPRPYSFVVALGVPVLGLLAAWRLYVKADAHAERARAART